MFNHQFLDCPDIKIIFGIFHFEVANYANNPAENLILSLEIANNVRVKKWKNILSLAVFCKNFALKLQVCPSKNSLEAGQAELLSC